MEWIWLLVGKAILEYILNTCLICTIPYKGVGVLPWTGGAVAGEQGLDGAEGEVQHGVGHGRGEDVVHVDGRHADLFVITAQNRDPELSVVPVVRIQRDVQGNTEGEMVIVFFLECVVVLGVVDLPHRGVLHV